MKKSKNPEKKSKINPRPIFFWFSWLSFGLEFEIIFNHYLVEDRDLGPNYFAVVPASLNTPVANRKGKLIGKKTE